MAKNNYSLLDLGGVATLPSVDDFNWKPKAPANPSQPSLLRTESPGSMDFGLDALKERYSVGAPGDVGKAPPGKKGGWLDAASVGLGVAEVGLGVYNALEQSKMNKFMRGYYGDQMALQRTDFENAAKGTNEALSSRQQRILSAQGATTGTEANRQGVADYMNQWGVKETA